MDISYNIHADTPNKSIPKESERTPDKECRICSGDNSVASRDCDAADFYAEKLYKTPSFWEPYLKTSFRTEYILSENPDVALMKSTWQQADTYNKKAIALKSIDHHIKKMDPAEVRDSQVWNFICKDIISELYKKIVRAGHNLCYDSLFVDQMCKSGCMIENHIHRCIDELDNTMDSESFFLIVRSLTEICQMRRKLGGDRPDQLEDFMRSDYFDAMIKQKLYSCAREWSDVPQMFADDSGTKYMDDYMYLLKWYLEHSYSKREHPERFANSLQQMFNNIITRCDFRCWAPVADLMFHVDSAANADNNGKNADNYIFGASHSRRLAFESITNRLINAAEIDGSEVSRIKRLAELIMAPYGNILNQQPSYIAANKSLELALINMIKVFTSRFGRQYKLESLTKGILRVYATAVRDEKKYCEKRYFTWDDVKCILDNIEVKDYRLKNEIEDITAVHYRYFDESTGTYSRNIRFDPVFRYFCGEEKGSYIADDDMFAAESNSMDKKYDDIFGDSKLWTFVKTKLPGDDSAWGQSLNDLDNEDCF